MEYQQVKNELTNIFNFMAKEEDGEKLGAMRRSLIGLVKTLEKFGWSNKDLREVTKGALAIDDEGVVIINTAGSWMPRTFMEKWQIKKTKYLIAVGLLDRAMNHNRVGFVRSYLGDILHNYELI